MLNTIIIAAIVLILIYLPFNKAVREIVKGLFKALFS